jgi:hypothetical protein
VTSASKASASDEHALQLFARLSLTLTAAPVLAPTATRRYLQMLRAAAGAQKIATVLQRFSELEQSDQDLVAAVKHRLVDDAALGPLVKNMILLWFTGHLPPAAPAAAGAPPAPTLASPDDYFDALMWSAVGAHPPGMSDAYFGHWRYPPDEGN